MGSKDKGSEGEPEVVFISDHLIEEFPDLFPDGTTIEEKILLHTNML